MTALFELAELAEVLQQDLDMATATELASLASDAVRGEIQQTITAVTGDTVTVYGDGNELLVLPELPVTGVTGVSVGGTALNVGEYEFRARGQLLRLALAGTADSSPVYYCWPAGTPVTVTYDHGYATVPGAIKSVALEIALATYANPSQVMSESVASYSVTYAFAGGATGQVAQFGLTDVQKRRLDPYRNLNM
jgi:hypothetical protein